MRGNLATGFDEGQETVRLIAGSAITAFVLWFLYQGFALVSDFHGSSY